MAKYFDEQDRADRRVPPVKDESFVACPACFLAALSPAQFSAQQQLYRIAYEKAQAQVAQRRDDSWTGDGLGI